MEDGLELEEELDWLLKKAGLIPLGGSPKVKELEEHGWPAREELGCNVVWPEGEGESALSSTGMLGNPKGWQSRKDLRIRESSSGRTLLDAKPGDPVVGVF